MRYSSAIARGEMKAADVPAMDGVNISWVHETDNESVSAAAALAKSFDIVYPPALIFSPAGGEAVDMKITRNVGSSMVNEQKIVMKAFSIDIVGKCFGKQ